MEVDDGMMNEEEDTDKKPKGKQKGKGRKQNKVNDH